MAVAVVTDSTADLDQDRLAGWGVRMVPLTVQIGDQSFQDRVELSPQEFLQRLSRARELPTTAAPSPAAFAAVYQEALDQGADSVVSIHLAGGLSATVRSAEMGSRLVSGPVYVVDGQTASLGTGLLVWWAVKRAQSGMDGRSIAQEVSAMAPRVRALAAPVTLEYLARGGRIGQAARLVGTLLAMKPVLAIDQGTVRPFRKVRGERQIVPAMVSGFGELVPAGHTVLAAVADSTNPEAVAALKAGLADAYVVAGWLNGVIGPVVATHVGPGAYGAILLPLTAEEAEWWKSFAAEPALAPS